MVCHHVILYGLPDTSIREAKERVRTAIKNSGYELRSRKVLINLAPANIRKEGAFFDLPIAVGILCSIGVIKNIPKEDIAFIGELSLDGKVNKVNGTLPMCIEGKSLGIKKVIVPKENALEASIVKGIFIKRDSKLLKQKQFTTNILKLGRNSRKSREIQCGFFRSKGTRKC